MSNKDRVARNVAGSSNPIPKLPVTLSLEVKMHPVKNVPVFAKYDSEKKEYLYSGSPIKGIFIGASMVLRAFDRTLGQNGGSITSFPYLSKNNIAVFAHTGTGIEIIARGDKNTVETEVARRFPTADKMSVRSLVYLFFFDKNGDPQLCQIDTNASLHFDSVKREKQRLSLCYAVYAPAEYSPKDTTISTATHKILGPFAVKNVPKYAKLATGDAIPDEEWDSEELTKVLDAWDEWSKFQMGESGAQPQSYGVQPEYSQELSAEMQDIADNMTHTAPPMGGGPADDELINDLPF